MRARFIGDPRHGGEGRDPFPFMGVVFPKGEWVEEIPDTVAAKLIGHSHFETEGGAKAADGEAIIEHIKATPPPVVITPPDADAAEIAQLRADLADLGITPHHKTGLTKLRDLLEQATKPGQE